MKNQTPLPPSGRDFEIYRRLHVEGCSTRAAALAAGLSQTRVCQIVENVGNYLTTVAPVKENQPREQQLAVAEQVASLRVDFLYGATLQSWRESQGTQTTTRELISAMKAPVTVKTTRNSPGDSRYLLLAARLAMMAARLPAACLELFAVGEEDDTSPVGDCSGRNAACSDDVDSALGLPLVSRFRDEVYEPTANQPPHDRREIFAPVQQPERREQTDVLSFAPAPKSPPLSRQQRRAQKKLLARKLGKG